MILSTHLFCLLNLSTTPQLFSHLLLAYTFDVLDLIRQHNQPNTIRYFLCMIYYVLYTMNYVLCTIYYTLCIIHYILCTMHYALCTMYYLLCTVYCALYTMHYTYVFIRIHIYLLFYTYSLFHGEIRKNPVIFVLTRSSRRVE